MTIDFGRYRAGVAAAVLVCGAWWGPVGAARAAAQTPAARQMESDPIRCWWKTDKTAVHVGEHFTLLLTCGVIDTARLRVEADPSKFDAGALALVPFEVLS